MLDRPGLLTEDMLPDLRKGQENFVRKLSEVENFAREGHGKRINLLEVVKQAKPTILVGCSTMAGAFTEQVCSFFPEING